MNFRENVALILVMGGMIIIGLMSLAIVGTAIYSSIRFGKPPEIISNWGGLIIGFFLGNFFNFARTALGIPLGSDDKKENS
ncbi:hypothetical protein [Rhizobium ruizarguesonis]|uniref:hypothetical protein n=1 Tax=Rhizobium ruizarguesonis TaxID=2081791 RepID=UPI00102F541D|nr:hypothetical protein [Rhizobium ruizarguesonis]TBE09284.1 hypothetical protein ELH12_26170 [Rhizobium ruizarguesonis]TBE80441.1 hypothetical protein ELH01_25970 [Rhizobium ruizarguesonis]TBE90096.1 hypothetical protein ELG99_26155 [Rhizobium ruizarguesonis]